MNKKLLGFTFSLIFALSSNVQSGETMSNDSAISLLVKASMQADYSDYKLLAQSLGFDVDHVEISKAIVENKESIEVTVTHVNFKPNKRTSIGLVSKDIDFNSFSSKNAKTRASLHLAVNSNELCISKAEFLKNFSPANSIQSTDGGTGLSHSFKDQNQRVIWATFDHNDCINQFTFMQN